MTEIAKLKPSDIPSGFPIKPIEDLLNADYGMTCGQCGLSWDDSIATGLTPVPSGRCPFEEFHRPAPYPKDITPLRFKLEFTLDPAAYLAYCKEENEEPNFDAWMDWAIEDAQDILNQQGELARKANWGIRSNLTPVDP